MKLYRELFLLVHVFPHIETLASQLNISCITVESAYQQLLAEGYVESKPKRGIFVANVDIDVIPNKN